MSTPKIDTLPRANLRDDLWFCASRWKFLSFRAYVLLKISSRNSSAGLFFEPLMLLVSCLAISIVWNQLFGRGGDEFYSFFLYVYISFAVWTFISELVVGGASCFIRNAKYATGSNDPLLIYVLQDVISATLSFVIKIPFLLLVLIGIQGVPSILGTFMFLLGIMLIVLSGVGFTLLVGALCVFFADLKELTRAAMRVAFLVTPIIWHVERLGEYQKYIYYNPFYNYLTVCREALLGGELRVLELSISVALTVALLMFGGLILKSKKRILRTAFFKS